MKRPKLLNQSGFSHFIVPFVVVLAVAGIGTYLMFLTHAATSTYEISNGNGICVNDPGNQGQTGINLTAKACDQTSRQIFALVGTGGVTSYHTYKVFPTSSAPECIGSAGNSTKTGTKLQAVDCSKALTLYQNTCTQLEIAKSGSGGCNGICVDSASGAMILSNCSHAGNWKPRAETATSSSGDGASGGSSGGSGSTGATGCAPAPSATMTNTVSSKCGFPDTTNTGTSGTLYAPGSGPTANTGSGWTVSGGTIAVKANGVLKNVNTGGKLVTVTGANATVENCKILANNTSGFGISLSGANNAVIKDNEIGDGSTSGNLEAGIKDFESGNTYSANTDIDANNIYRVSTGIQVDHGTIQNNYVHDLVGVNGEHINGTTSNGGSDGTKMTLQHNTVFNPNGQTDAISLFEDFGVQKNRVINDNLMAGGGYTLYAGQNSGGPAVSDIVVTNNHFSPMYKMQNTYGAYGYHGTNEKYGSNGNVWSGNVDDSTGKTLGP